MDIYILLIVLMFILGVSDLIVGVANDAVNFTNSAFGSRAATRNVILLVAGIGIVLGAISSSGMMEVARKGIFNPQFFTVEELFIIFGAVMVTDIVLLDLYNTFGLPTSTTVSLVFEILGAAAVVALIKSQGGSEAIDGINTDQVLKTVSAIVLSVIIAFVGGAFFQFFARLLFTFQIEKRVKKYGAPFSGLAMATILVFLTFKGLAKSSIVDKQIVAMLEANLMLYFWGLAAGLTLLFYLIQNKVDILKIVVLVGTGALAMAFAMNDLVNFIGVPVAAYEGYNIFVDSGSSLTASGAPLADVTGGSTWILAGAAIVMMLTLIFSRKAQTVTKTEINLSSVKDTQNTYGSNAAGRLFVQVYLDIWGAVRSIFPDALRELVNRRFEKRRSVDRSLAGLNHEAFDLLRASVNIMASSAIIMYGSFNKLPLSTTFVTFMAAMGTSLADRAWGRENAVARVSGVLVVISSWFMTAIIAAIISGLMAAIVWQFGLPAIFVLAGFSYFLMFQLSRLHDKREKAIEAVDRELAHIAGKPNQMMKHMLGALVDIYKKFEQILEDIVDGLEDGKRKPVRKAWSSIQEQRNLLVKLNERAIHFSQNQFDEERDLVAIFALHTAFSQGLALSHSLERLHGEGLERLEIYHTALTDKEMDEVDRLLKFSEHLTDEIQHFKSAKRPAIADTRKFMDELDRVKMRINVDQLKRIREGNRSVKTGISFLTIVSELVNYNELLVDTLMEMNKVAFWLNPRSEQKSIDLPKATKAEWRKKKKK